MWRALLVAAALLGGPAASAVNLSALNARTLCTVAVLAVDGTRIQDIDPAFERQVTDTLRAAGFVPNNVTGCTWHVGVLMRRNGMDLRSSVSVEMSGPVLFLGGVNAGGVNAGRSLDFSYNAYGTDPTWKAQQAMALLAVEDFILEWTRQHR